MTLTKPQAKILGLQAKLEAPVHSRFASGSGDEPERESNLNRLQSGNYRWLQVLEGLRSHYKAAGKQATLFAQH